ncbi:MAG: hypothetical protein K8I02_08880, partial [Candidatus Methylomirabilis sp.]|nr:hypothetical protein [Deltaproteobacteria bacterium]
LLGVAVGAEQVTALPACGPEGAERSAVYASALTPGSFSPPLFCTQVGYTDDAPFELMFLTAFVTDFDGATGGTNLRLEGAGGVASPFVPTLDRNVDIPLALNLDFSATDIASDGGKIVFTLTPAAVFIVGQQPIPELSGAIKLECASGETPPALNPEAADEVIASLECIFSVIDNSLPGVPIQLCAFEVSAGRFVIPGMLARAGAALNP